jgi:truncated hemoglobin YjbI
MTPARRTDIADRQDIADALAAFYSRLFADDLPSSVFVDVTHMDLAAHLPAMCDCWDTVLHRPGRYRCNALRVHTSLHDKTRLTAAHLSRWVALWTATFDERHVGLKADLDQSQAIRIAWSFNRRLNGRSSDEPNCLTRRVAGWDPYLSAVTAEAVS